MDEPQTSGGAHEAAWRGVPLTEREVRIAGRPWRIAAVEDEAALLALAGEREPFPFGLLLWEGAIALGEALVEQSQRVRAGRVLELGCGVGLSGLVAASLGAAVTATDHDPIALEAARRNASLNGVEGVRHVSGDWTRWTDAGLYDVIIGADVTYEREAHAAVLAILARNLAPLGLALLADPGRQEQAAFIATARAAGFSVDVELRRVPDLVRAGHVVEVSLLTLARAGTGGGVGGWPYGPG